MGKISPLKSLLLTHLVRNNNVPLIRSTKKDKNTKEVFSAMVGKNKIKV